MRWPIAVKSVAVSPVIAVGVVVPDARSTVTNPPRVDRYTVPRSSPAMAVAGPGNVTVRPEAVGPTIVTLAAACGSAPGDNTASAAVARSKIAAAGCPPSGSTWPTGAVAGGGDTAALAGSTVAGATSVSFDEHPVTVSRTVSSSASIPHTLMRIARPDCCGNRWPPGSVGVGCESWIGSSARV